MKIRLFYSSTSIRQDRAFRKSTTGLLIPLLLAGILGVSCQNDGNDVFTGDRLSLDSRSSIPKISYDAEITSRIIPEEGTLQDMCKVDLLMIQRLPSKEHVEFVMDTTTTPCISIERSELTYEALRSDMQGESDFSFAGSFSFCDGIVTQIHGDTVVTSSDQLDFEFWQEIYRSYTMSVDEELTLAQQAYDQMLVDGIAEVDGEFYKMTITSPDGEAIVRYVSMANLLPHSEIVYNTSGKWSEKYFYQYLCQGDTSYIPFVTHTYVRDTTGKCGTPYISETITEFKNFQKISI